MIKFKKSLLFCALIIFTQSYQNCAQPFSFNDAGMVSLGSVDLTHPGAESATGSSQKILVYNKTYVAQLLREIFTSPGMPPASLEYFINRWIFYRGAQFGQGCDPYSTYGGQDCGGSIANANVPLQFEDNVLRESYRLQFCQEVLGMDQGVNAILEKIVNRSVAPTPAAVAQIYLMFYRGDEPTQSVLNALMDFDTALAKNGESVFNRWRAVSLQICESPGWQLQ